MNVNYGLQILVICYISRFGPACMCVCTVRLSGVLRSQMRALNVLELELRTVVNMWMLRTERVYSVRKAL